MDKPDESQDLGEALKNQLDRNLKALAKPRARKRNLKDANTKEAKKSGWKVCAGDPDDWKVVCKASNEKLGIMKSTKRLAVPGGWIYQVSTEHKGLGVAEALAFVPAAKRTQ